MKKLDPRIILKGKKTVAAEEGVELRDLKYNGVSDATDIEPGWYQLQFKIITKGHPKFGYNSGYDYYEKG